MVKVDKLFFELLQVALGNRECLSRIPFDKEWAGLYDESERQAVTGILLQGIERLKANTDGTDYTNNLPLELLLQWIGIGEQIRQGNLSLTKRCKQLQGKVSDLGHNSSILKGQGVALYYDEPLRELRQSGDIDIFVGCGLKGAMEIARLLGVENPKWDFKHLHLDLWEDTEIEMHYRVEVLLNQWKNRKLQRWFMEHQNAIFNANDNLDLNSNTDRTNDTNRFVTPTVEFNVFYILLHIYRHFLYEGVGMRQIVDYYFVLKRLNLNANDNLKSNTNHTNRANFAIDAVKEFGMERFAKGLMWVMQDALGMPRDWMLWEPDDKEGKYILDEVMVGGNFGHHDQRLTHGGGKWNTVKQVCRHNWHLMRHYPADVIWAPVWFVWHKCWKLKTKMLLAINL